MAPLTGHDQARNGKLSLSQEWAWAAGIVAIPVIIFGAFEMMMWMRRRRVDAVARRSKEPPPRPDSRIRPGRGA
jgi:hypothetical protein